MAKQLDLFDFEDQYSVFSLIENEFLPGEYFEIEYKSAQEGFPKEFWKTYSAFANTNTGIIILGVSEKKGEFYLETENKGRWTMYRIKKDAKVATSPLKVATSDKKVATSEPPAASGRMKRADLENLIIQYCTGYYRTKEELATFLHKSEDYLRNKILPNMEKKGMLKKKFPFTHNHPEQAYQTEEEYAAKL